jgi:uncharacterized protein (DUF934 family)
MRQIIRQREIVADAWRYPGEAGEGPQALTLAGFEAAVQAGTAPLTGMGVVLEPADAVEKLVPEIRRLSLVVVNFPKNGEGRGFTQGQLLRQRYRYAGELRAAGAIKRDYLFFLARCGFDAFDLDPGEDLVASLAMFQSFSVAYQSGSDRGVQLRARR